MYSNYASLLTFHTQQCPNSQHPVESKQNLDQDLLPITPSELLYDLYQAKKQENMLNQWLGKMKINPVYITV